MARYQVHTLEGQLLDIEQRLNKDAEQGYVIVYALPAGPSFKPMVIMEQRGASWGWGLVLVALVAIAALVLGWMKARGL